MAKSKTTVAEPSKVKSKKKKEKSPEELLQAKRKKDHDKSIKLAKQENDENDERGKVSCDKLPHRFAPKSVDKSWPLREGYKNVNCCSAAPGINKQLSPMKLGPYTYEHPGEGTFGITNLENLWQFSKVFVGEENPKTKRPTSEFFDRRKNGWKDTKAHRHVKRDKCLYSYWKGEKLSYMEARRKIYCPLYAEKVVETEAYKKIKKLVDDGYNVQILGFDGYDYEGKTLKECFEDVSKPFGHELVLCCLLTDNLVWEEDEDEEEEDEE